MKFYSETKILQQHLSIVHSASYFCSILVSINSVFKCGHVVSVPHNHADFASSWRQNISDFSEYSLNIITVYFACELKSSHWCINNRQLNKMYKNKKCLNYSTWESTPSMYSYVSVIQQPYVSEARCGMFIYNTGILPSFGFKINYLIYFIH